MASTRITDKDLDAACERLNKLAGTPAQPYALNPETGRHQAQVGNYHISHAYGGVCLHQMSNTSGGARAVLMGGHVPKRELFNALHAYIAGFDEARHLASAKA